MTSLTSVEICAGAGGQAFGIEEAGFKHLALVDDDVHCCRTLKLNRPDWNVVECDLRNFSGVGYFGADLLAGGLPCPPFSVAGKQLGDLDERNLFPTAARLATEIQPKAIMIENVRGILDPKFISFRNEFEEKLGTDNYIFHWKLYNASDFGVPQLRPRVIMVAIRHEFSDRFEMPSAVLKAPTVGDTLFDLMQSRGWSGARNWKKKANKIAPTIVGGSKKHGGPDLGPTRARKAWAELGVNGKSIAEDPPGSDFETDAMPRLTIRMVARLQGFSDSWQFSGRKTAAYRQVGNAFPPPVAKVVAERIRIALDTKLSTVRLQKAG